MKKLTAQEANELAKKANKEKIIYQDILYWIFKMIEEHASEGFTGTRLNLIQKKRFFDKGDGDKWPEEIKDWNLIIKKLTTDFKEHGYRINNAEGHDFHITY